MRAIVDLEALGYVFTVANRRIHYAHIGATPDAATVRPLLAAVKAHRDTALDYLVGRALVELPPDPDETPAVIEPGWWHTGELPEAPPPLDAGETRLAEYWGWPPLAPDVPPAAVDFYQPGECRRTLFCGPLGYPPVPSREQALARLGRFASHEQTDDAHDDGDDLDRRDYLRGPLGQHDRETIWRGGLGRLPGTGEGGLPIGWKPPTADEVAEWLRAGREKAAAAALGQVP